MNMRYFAPVHKNLVKKLNNETWIRGYCRIIYKFIAIKRFFSTGSFYEQVKENCDEIIEFLLKNAVTPEALAPKLESVGLINFTVRERAELSTVPKSERMRTVMDAVISRLKLKEENAKKFKSVLNKFGVLEDIIHIMNM